MDNLSLGPVSSKARLIAIIGTIILTIIIIWLIKKGYLKAGYSLLWFLMIGAIFILSISESALFLLSTSLGVYYAPAALFAVLFVILILISIHFSIVTSRHEQRINKLAQEIALLKKKHEDK